jgi:hypothetical protein
VKARGDDWTVVPCCLKVREDARVRPNRGAVSQIRGDGRRVQKNDAALDHSIAS